MKEKENFAITPENTARILSGYEALIAKTKEVGAEYGRAFNFFFDPEDLDHVGFNNGEVSIHWSECNWRGEEEHRSLKFSMGLLYMPPFLREDTIKNLKAEHDRAVAEKTKKTNAEKEKT